MAYAAQSDASFTTGNHTIRTGLYLQSDHSISNTASGVLATNPAGMQITDIPMSIIDDGSATEWIYSGYLQDEWKIVPNLTANYGLRFDKFTAYTADKQLSPRLNVVWDQPATDGRGESTTRRTRELLRPRGAAEIHPGAYHRARHLLQAVEESGR
jgi:outer membrane receptor protein involved in Fe transport